MRPLRFLLNITLDGCYDHRAALPDAALHQHVADCIARADALILGRTTYQMMEQAWRLPGALNAMPAWTHPFARTIDAAKKYVVSRTLPGVDWNAELVRGDVRQAVAELKRESGTGLLVAGVTLGLALTQLRLIDEYEFVVHPRVVGHGPTLFAGLATPLELTLVHRLELASGALALRYQVRQ